MRVAFKSRSGIALCSVLAINSFCLPAQPALLPEPLLIDRVVAVVNKTVILASDLDREMHLSMLEPKESAKAAPDAAGALERLISRTLIQQQIRNEEQQATEPTDADIQARLAQLRAQLPACVRMHCATDDGWAAFLNANSLTQAEVENYLRLRLEMLSFIESRFRQGIRVSQEEIDDYYTKTLRPQYPATQPAPPIEAVAPRIEEILLQEKVNAMFDAWLENLRKQGDVEIVDPALASAKAQESTAGGEP